MTANELERLASHIQAFSGNYREIKLAHAVIVLITERRKVAEMVRGLKQEHDGIGFDPNIGEHGGHRVCHSAGCYCGADSHNAAVDAILDMLK